MPINNGTDNAIDVAMDDAGIVTLTLDTPGRSTNLINEPFFDALAAALERIHADPAVSGVIVTSSKASFLVGADLDTIFSATDPAHYFAMAQRFKGHLRTLETLGKPVVAALNGSALGGGLEVALACHRRIALDDDPIRFGFPEVGLGLLPGGGGVVRTVRLLGLEVALEWLIRNKQYTPHQALAAGMIHAVAESEAELLAQARAWIKANPAAAAPWDRANQTRIPGGGPANPKIAQQLAIAPAMLRKETGGNYPAPLAILAAMVEGAQVDFATASRIESRYFAQLAAGQVSRNLISAFWTQLNQIKRGESRPAAIPPQPTSRVGVLGAGMMGHGIAYVTALAGLPVVMTEREETLAARGKERIGKLAAKQVARGRMGDDEATQLLARITATTDYAQLADCDLIIEAVFEDRAVKAAATAAAALQMPPTSVVASNTSTLPITTLAQALAQPENFIGMHFFSPVERMRLVEIIVGTETSATTLAKAFDFVRAIGKVPIVVNDSRGFYTSRVFSAWTNEGMAMLVEGVLPSLIEAAALAAGLPVGPLALMDEISLTLADQIRQQAAADGDASGKIALAHPAYAVLDAMLAAGRTGRAHGSGFYTYVEADKALWSGLTQLFPPDAEQPTQQVLIDRLLFIQSLETVRCLAEGVLSSVADANLGAIFGWGYPACHGGPLQFINAYGGAAFVARSRELAAVHGDRFAPPPLLLERVAQGQPF